MMSTDVVEAAVVDACLALLKYGFGACMVCLIITIAFSVL